MSLGKCWCMQQNLHALVKTRQQFLNSGMSYYEFQRKLTRHEIISVHRGVYALRSDFATLKPWEKKNLATFAFHARKPQSIFSHTSAVLLHGLPLLEPSSAVHIDVPKNHGGQMQGVHKHRRFSADTPVIMTEHGALTIGFLQMVIDCAATLPFENALVVADCLAQRRWVNPNDFRAQLLAYRGTSYRRVHRVAQAIGDLSESPGETLVKIILDELGIRYIQQYEVQTPAGRFRADFYLPDYDVLIEFDGMVKYLDLAPSTDRALLDEREREKHLTNMGYRIFRTNWQQVRKNASFVSSLQLFLRRTGFKSE